jgi:hypothetical protein
VRATKVSVIAVAGLAGERSAFPFYPPQKTALKAVTDPTKDAIILRQVSLLRAVRASPHGTVAGRAASGFLAKLWCALLFVTWICILAAEEALQLWEFSKFILQPEASKDDSSLLHEVPVTDTSLFIKVPATDTSGS